MAIFLTRNQATDIRWFDDKHKLFIRSSFYLGYSLNYIEGMVGNPMAKIEVDDVVQTALALGLDDDYIVSVR